MLNDVAIINSPADEAGENDIWAVGEIYIADTSQNGYTLYNAVHWDGNTWKPKRISVVYNGNLITPPLYGIYSFSSTDIWLSAGIPIHGDGENWVQYHLFDMGILGQDDGHLTKIWGGSSNDIYFVGTRGTIAHYQNGQWSRIESGTTTIIQDIWGSADLILCAVSNVASPGDRKILKINNNQVADFLWDTGRRVQSIWFKNINAIYTCGGGVFSLKDDSGWHEINDIPLYYSESIRGEDYNDIWVVGDFGLLAHFNGFSWKVFDEPSADIYYSCAVKGNIIVTVGTKGGKAIISYGSY